MLIHLKWFSLLVLLPLLLSVRPAHAADDDDNYRSDVLYCEEALGKLAECCPSFVTSEVACTYERRESSGCDWSTTVTVRPAFNDAESRCILASTCQVLVGSGVCPRAQVATDYVSAHRSSIDAPEVGPDSNHAAVCP